VEASDPLKYTYVQNLFSDFLYTTLVLMIYCRYNAGTNHYYEVITL